MSWVFGFSGTNLSPSYQARLATIHDPPIHTIEHRGLYIAAGGLPETCLIDSTEETTNRGWAVVGLGIQRHDAHSSFLESDDWRQRLAVSSPTFEGLDGHFIVLRWRPDQLEAFTDVLGTRTLYLARSSGGLAFSSRLDWLAAIRGGGEIDFAEFGSHWLTFNQLSTTCLLTGIRRLGPRGHASWKNDHLEITEQAWTPEITKKDQTGDAFARTLAALVRPEPDRAETSLGLSGGLDSRLLLALRCGGPNVFAHVFGADDHPDVQVARRIADGEGLVLDHLHHPIPDVDACLTLLRRHVAQAQAVSAASSVIGLRYYEELRAKRQIMIDGGLGESARRQFMNRLLHGGRHALRSGESKAILPYLRVNRADIFNEEVQSTMVRGAEQQIAWLWDALPVPEEIGDENFLDLLGVRTRLPNFFGFEQNRLDAIIQNYMPFAQPSLLQAVFHTPLTLRRDGRLFRKLIRSRRVTLARYPLVKGGVSYPFRLRTIPAYAWTKTKKQLGLDYSEPTRSHFLEIIKPFALDAVHSQHVREYAAYDVPRLTQIVEDYYNGETSLAGPVDWWLAFEMWRQVVS